MKKKVVAIYGTRPEGVKMAPIVKRLYADDRFEPCIINTGQHREMLDQINDLFDISPDRNLNVMRHGASLSELASETLNSLHRHLTEEAPDAVIVQGDTSTAFIGGLSAFYQRIPVVHVEAGLRTGDVDSPFPEEANRQMLSRIASLHLAPTSSAKANLLKEGVVAQSITVTGNTVVDALLDALNSPASFIDPMVRDVIENDRPLVLVTAHRRESWGDRMREAMSAVRLAATSYPEIDWLVPMHRNPLVRDVLMSALSGLPNVFLCEPLSYHEFCHAMQASRFIITDSGGVQEEAPSLGKPVLVMRDNTERPEAVVAGSAVLVGTSSSEIFHWISTLISSESAFNRMSQAGNPFGDGQAAERCVAAISQLLNVGGGPREFSFDENC